MSDIQTIIRVGAEGGDWALLGRQRAKGEWEFQTRLADQSLALIDEPGEISRSSGWLDDWRAAMLSFARYPWERLAPEAVHGDFRELVWDAIVRRSGLLKKAGGFSRVAEWTELCGRTPSDVSELVAGPDSAGISLRGRDGSLITSLDAWARPKEAYQWQDGRSAKELARAWLTHSGGRCPPELRRLLDTVPQTQGIRLMEAWPEYVTPLPERGEGRNHDLYLRGDQYGTPVTICCEAKADEPFGTALIGEYVREASSRVRSDGSPVASGVPARAGKMLNLLVYGADPLSEPYASLRYQLLTAIAGTVLQAESDGSPLAVFFVHELRSDKLDKGKLDQNDADLASMLQVLGFPYFGPGHLLGPIRTRPSSLFSGRSIDLFIGKIITNLASHPNLQ